MKKNKIEPATVWYESLGLDKNPFSIKPGENKSIIGLDFVVSQVIDQVENNKMCIVEGNYGAGKTTFLKQLINYFGGQKKVIYFSCNRLNKELNVDKLLYERFGVFTKVLRIKSKQMILLLDEAQFLTQKDTTLLHKYYKAGYFRSIVFVTHDSLLIPFSKSVAKQMEKKKYTFGKLDSSQIFEIISERIQHPFLTQETVSTIYSRDTRMRQFLKNCDIFMRHMCSTNRKTAKSKDVVKILQNHFV